MAVTLRWLNEAANGGATYERFVEQGDPRVAGGGAREETFGTVEAGLFRHGGRVEMLVENASDQARVWRSGPELGLGIPSRVEYLTTPDLMDTQVRPAKIVQGEATARIQLPAWSLTRIEWNRR